MGSTGRKRTPEETGISRANRETKPQHEGPIDKAALINKLLHSIERRLDKDELKATLGDLIRLLQLQKELDEEQPGEIEVKWVEPEPVNASGE